MRRIYLKPIVLAWLALLLTAASVGQSPPQVKDGKISGAGFVITLPPDLAVEIAATSESEHGFSIDLPPRPVGSVQLRSSRTPTSYRYIAFDTKWDSGDMPSLDAVVNNISSNLLDSVPADLVNAGEISLDGNFPARLGSLPARRLILKYRNTQHKPAIRQIIVAYNARKDASAIVYMLILNTTEQNFQEDVSIFSKVIAGFKLADQ